MKILNSCSFGLMVLTVMLAITACGQEPKYKTGDYLMPSDSSNPAEIVKVVAASDTTYKVFTHFLSEGKLIQAQDYQSRPIKTVDTGYMVVEPPNFEGTFSPNKFLSRHGDK